MIPDRSLSPPISSTTLSVALKEWAIAVQALAAGETILLLRKGGIREAQGRFQVQHDQVWLYPTTEHQRADWLQSPYAAAISPGLDQQPNPITLTAWAMITHVLVGREPAAIARLAPFHIWTEQFVTERLQWKPQQPLYILLLRTYRLAEPVQIPYHSTYGGCRSWIELATPLALSPATPALDEAAYQARVTQIIDCLD